MDKRITKIALIAPTPLESEELMGEISPCSETKTIFEGELYGKSILFSNCGVGKVNAAHSATLMLENHSVDLLVLFGIGGAYKSMRAGDVAVAESENYAEEGIMMVDGWRPMESIGFPLFKKEKEYFNTFLMDHELSQHAVNVSKDLGMNVVSGNFVTVSQCSGTCESGEIMMKRWNGICENMEGAAVAHICAIYGIPMVEIRGISNVIEDRDTKKWNIPLAVSNCNMAVSEMIKRLK